MHNEINDDYYFITDDLQNIIIFDYILRDEKNTRYEKCYLMYKYGKRNFFHLSENKKKYGCFI